MLNQLSSGDLANVIMTTEICATIFGCFFVAGVATCVGLVSISRAAAKVFPNQKLPEVKLNA